jgi:hypothetical protein
MKSVIIRASTLGWLTWSVFAFYACDSKHTLIEAFLQNGTETKLFTYGGNSYNLGKSVAIGDNLALVGNGSASAYSYRWDGVTWVKEANWTFGRSAALSGHVAVVGSSSGAVNVYRFNGLHWQEEAQLTASNGATANGFGYAVAISGDVIAVGENDGNWSSIDDNRYPDAGFVYIYRFNGSSWMEEAKLTAGAGAYGFGSTVSINGNLAIVGAWGIDGSADDTGMAYVYRFRGSQWQEEAQLTPEDATEGDRFGRAIAVSGDVAIVGAPYDDESVENSGSAYIFRYDGSSWHQETKLSFEFAGAYFGSAVAVVQEVAIVGAPFNDDNDYETGNEPGAAYVYR